MSNQEKFKTMIGGQALIEGLMMRGPQKDAIVVRGKDGMTVEVTERKVHSGKSPLKWPLIRGVVGFFDSQICGVKAILKSADLSPEENQEEPSKFDKWLEKKLGSKKFQSFVVGSAVVMGLALSIFLFMLLPSVIGSFFDRWVSNLVQNFIEGAVRIVIFVAYILAISRAKDMKRVFAYHGAEHKTIRCYEAQLPLTVENVRQQTRLHPRCGTSFLLVVMIISILLFSVASTALLTAVPSLALMKGTIAYRLIMIGFKLLLLPMVVAFSYEVNRLVGRHNNLFTRIISAPGMWLQYFTTCEPDDSMIEVGIAALNAVLPTNEGDDRW